MQSSAGDNAKQRREVEAWLETWKSIAVFNQSQPQASSFCFSHGGGSVLNFKSLAVVYGKPSVRFTVPIHPRV